MIHEYEIAVTKQLGARAIEAAKLHAIVKFPEESCGFIVGGRYVPCENRHPKPLEFFRIEEAHFDTAMRAGQVTAIVHSHPNGPIFPSHADMMQQIATDVPWVIVSLNETGIHKIVAWGGDLPIAPVIGRPFLHGVLDCYSLIRDVFRLGRVELLKQGVHWPHDPILLADIARADEWWKTGDDLYSANFAPWGFKVINRVEAAAGDVFLIKYGNETQNPQGQLNHGGVMLDHGQILHHLTSRPSGREPNSIWARAADLWVRYEGKPS